MGAHCLYLYFVAKMVKLIITSGCILEIQSTSPNSRSYPWNIQCLSPNHFKNPIHIPFNCENSTSLRLSLPFGLLISIIPINRGPYIYPVVPGIVCHHASWSPCAKVQPGPFEHFPSCQNLQRSFFLSDDRRRFATSKFWYIRRLLSCCIIDPFTAVVFILSTTCTLFWNLGTVQRLGFLTIDSTRN